LVSINVSALYRARLVHCMLETSDIDTSTVDPYVFVAHWPLIDAHLVQN